MDPNSRRVVLLAHLQRVLGRVVADNSFWFSHSFRESCQRWRQMAVTSPSAESRANKFVTVGRCQLVIFSSETAGTIGILPMTTCPAGYGVVLTHAATQTR